MKNFSLKDTNGRGKCQDTGWGKILKTYIIKSGKEYKEFLQVYKMKAGISTERNGLKF